MAGTAASPAREDERLVQTGALARLLASTRAEPADAAAVATLARRAGLRVERKNNNLNVIVPA